MKKHRIISVSKARQLLGAMNNQREGLKTQEGFARRVSKKGVASRYQTFPVYKFNVETKKVYHSAVPKALEAIRNEAWILNFPKSTSLDVDNWDHTTNFDIISISLRDGQKFEVGSEEFRLDAGECVRFGLDIPHKVSPVSEENTYLVFAVMKYLENDPYDYLNKD